MKYILLLSVLLFVSACGHKHGDHKHEGTKAEDCGCGHHEAEKKHCDGKCDHTEGTPHHGEKDHDCAACAHHTEKKAWDLSGNAQLSASISEEDFQKGYLSNSAKLGLSCTSAAQEYCGKTTKDMMVTEQEVGCLWAKAHRVTREKLPKLDKTACEKLLKGMVAKKKK